jgi:hypothetical protein
MYSVPSGTFLCPDLRNSIMTQGGGRQVFFSFDYEEDRNRAEAVFQLLRKQDAVPGETSFPGSSLWRTATDPSSEEAKRLVRETIGRTLATCVLVGARTSEREWIRYEIAQSLARGNGLLAVRISGIADSGARAASPAGRNPLAYLGLGKSRDGEYFIFENSSAQWIRYQDHPEPITRPSYLPEMSVGYVQPLTVGLVEYDYVKQDGAGNLPAWIERAINAAGK